MLVGVQEYSVTYFRPNKVMPNEGQSLKSKQTFRFEVEQYFLIGFEVFTPHVSCLCAHDPKITTDHMTFEFEH